MGVSGAVLAPEAQLQALVRQWGGFATDGAKGGRKLQAQRHPTHCLHELHRVTRCCTGPPHDTQAAVVMWCSLEVMQGLVPCTRLAGRLASACSHNDDSNMCCMDTRCSCQRYLERLIYGFVSGWRMGPRDDPTLEWTKLPGLAIVLQLVETALLQNVYTSKLQLYRSLPASAEVCQGTCMHLGHWTCYQLS